MSITAHCLVKNEEVFVAQAIKSVIDFVDFMIVYDTGSTDQTVKKIEQLVKEYPNKIIFEQKGLSDKKRHTELRQEMLSRTTTDWFMILDGDEVWTKRAMQEALEIMKRPEIKCVVAPFYLCVGDIYHHYHKRGEMKVLGQKDFLATRFIKKTDGVHWVGDFIQDTLYNDQKKGFENTSNTVITSARYWHMTHLKRSSSDDRDYSSGGNRLSKRRLTYFIIGRKIKEPVPEVFFDKPYPRLGFITSVVNFFKLALHK